MLSLGLDTCLPSERKGTPRGSQSGLEYPRLKDARDDNDMCRSYTRTNGLQTCEHRIFRPTSEGTSIGPKDTADESTPDMWDYQLGTDQEAQHSVLIPYMDFGSENERLRSTPVHEENIIAMSSENLGLR